jgi:GDP-L-fucose synthase
MVGKSLVRYGLRHGLKMLTADRSELDLTDSKAVLSFLQKHQPKEIILAAAKVGGIYANMSQRSDFLIQNIRIQNSVILGALETGIENFVFLGSSCIYPREAAQPISEEALLAGPLELTNEAYALAKISGVKLCQYIREENGFNYFSLMPTNLYGPEDNFDLKTSHVPAALMRKFHEANILGATSLEIWGSGNPLREFMHVDDLADAIWFSLRNPPVHSLVNVGGGAEISIANFAKLMAKVVNFRGEIRYDSTMPDGTPRKLLNAKILTDLGWQPKISLEEGLGSTYKWFTENLFLGKVRGYVK